MKKIYRFIAFFAALMIFSAGVQAQWGAPYSNSWIVYGRPYVKVGVTQKGIHKLPFSLLPASFPVNDPAKLQLWHRGQEIAILSVANNEITFYAVPNDGASDSLFYRPSSSRMNPYWSMYSDESAYFLTVGTTAGLRAEQVNREADPGAVPAAFHLAKSVVTFKTDYSLSTGNYIRPTFFNSFFELGASRTGKVSMGGAATNFSLQLTNRVADAGVKPVVKLLVHGRSNGPRKIEVYIGKTAQSLRLVKSIASSNFEGSEYSFPLEEDDMDASGKSVLSLKSVGTSELDGYSIAYYALTYPQSFDMKGRTSAEFTLLPGSESLSKIGFANTPENATFLDISDVDRPRIITGQPGSLMVPRSAGKPLAMLVSKDVITVAQAKVASVDFSKTFATSADFIIVTSENLLEGANTYAAYRASADGGGHNTLVAGIRDLYNQFNYGEPSPLAIRRFVDYMISKGVDKKYLYLIGKSITYNERMVRELPDEVPAVGFPASDVLLVEGLAGAPRDVPAIPVGRLGAVSNQNILDYLQKVKEYEHNVSGDLSWRKNILHLNGGKTVSEITQLKQLLAALTPVVETGVIGGSVKQFVKQQAVGEAEPVNITPEVNSGVGMITYFGHGSTTVTDLDMGYITDAGRGYNNANKYPLMYFNGCGVGNIFVGRNNPNPTSGDRYALSMDWMLTPKKGAIAIIANSFESFVTPSSKYLNQLYSYIFADPVRSVQAIGQIQSAVAAKIMAEDANMYSIANIHQSILQGDPSIKLISVPNADYAVDKEQGIRISATTPDMTIGTAQNLKVDFFIQNSGRYVPGQNVPVEVTYTYKDGPKSVKTMLAGFALRDTLSLSIANDKNLSRIKISVDPANTLSELSKTNNIAELLIDWELAETEYSYPQGTTKDLVPPRIDVQFNSRNIRNGETVAPNSPITITMTDDRIMLADTSLLSVFVKFCGDNSCDFERIAYSKLGTLSVSPQSDRVLTLSIKPEFLINSGEYEILVTGIDVAGNTTEIPYTIRFRIRNEADQRVKVIANPNPATDFVRFETEATEVRAFDSIRWKVYNLSGIVVAEGEEKTPGPGIKEWYWMPTKLAGGLYLYGVDFLSNSQVTETATGKVVLIR